MDANGTPQRTSEATQGGTQGDGPRRDGRAAFADAAARVAAGADHHAEAADLVARMTPAEKLDCLDGDVDFWPGIFEMMAGGYHTRSWPAAKVERLGIPGIEFVDGPRGSAVGAATCFPVSMARGASFDPDLETRVGEVIGSEIRAVGGTFTGAVCCNLLRHPGWGRAQETYGEEPHHVGEMAAALTRGLQRHVMACMKHFALNSMENARFVVDVTVDDRALHEVYLPHFRRVAEEGVASTMSAYNSVNGQWCGDHAALLTEILRNEWGWDGFVITDFIFGLRDPIGSVAAGCEIEMPFRQQRAQVLAEALDDGRLDTADVDLAVTRIVATLLRFADRLREPDGAAGDVLAAPRHRALAREAAVAGSVLLSNDGTLPLDPTGLRRITVLGRLAAVPNLGDGGSSDVLPPSVVTPLDGIVAAVPGAVVVHHDDDPALAADADLTVVVVGNTKDDEGEYIDPSTTAQLAHLMPPRPGAPLIPGDEPADAPASDPPAAPESREVASTGGEQPGFSVGGDRRTLRLSASDESLIAAAARTARGPVVVVTMGGATQVVPWLDDVNAAIAIWYPGMEGGAALGDLLTGVEEPGGRLPFAVPRDEADLVPFDPDATTVTYDLFHGHWHLDRVGRPPHLPFGHGLGYTTFSVDAARFDGPARVAVDVTNTGDRAGTTVVFAFAGLPASSVERPRRRLVGFRKVRCAAGRSVEVTIDLDFRQLDVRRAGAWWTEPGRYRLEIGQYAGDTSVQIDVER